MVDVMEYFIELYCSLPRGGPGDDRSTQRALEMMEGLPPAPRILDVGCGPGVQTLELLRLSDGKVTALDLLPQMLKRTVDAVKEAGYSDRLAPIEADMNAMPFAPASFDIVWSEGSLYLLGFENGVGKVRELLKPGGFSAVSESVWLKPDPPEEVLKFWEASYPEIDLVERKLESIAGQGMTTVGHFILPSSSWTEPYYDHLEARLPEYESRWKGIAEAEDVLEEARQEIAIFRKYSDFYSYAFFVMRK
jgi:ubiquinone/menaquinone biosynthesis C-methylase UbiE